MIGQFSFYNMKEWNSQSSRRQSYGGNHTNGSLSKDTLFRKVILRKDFPNVLIICFKMRPKISWMFCYEIYVYSSSIKVRTHFVLTPILLMVKKWLTQHSVILNLRKSHPRWQYIEILIINWWIKIVVILCIWLA